MSVCPQVTDVLVMLRVVKREVLEFVRPGETKNWIFCESRQDFIAFFCAQG